MLMRELNGGQWAGSSRCYYLYVSFWRSEDAEAAGDSLSIPAPFTWISSLALRMTGKTGFEARDPAKIPFRFQGGAIVCSTWLAHAGPVIRELVALCPGV